MFDEGVFWGLASIAGVILGLGIPYIFIFRKRTTEMQTLIDSLIDIALGQVYEKIAVLQEYITDVLRWKIKGIDPVRKTDRICSDIKSMWRLQRLMPPEQKSELSGIIRRLIEAMEKDYEEQAGRIKDASSPLKLL
jgi:hypothetical protein